MPHQPLYTNSPIGAVPTAVPGVYALHLMTTEILADSYEKAGNFLRRKDASVEKPSPVLDVGDVLAIARAEIVALEDLLREANRKNELHQTRIDGLLLLLEAAAGVGPENRGAFRDLLLAKAKS